MTVFSRVGQRQGGSVCAHLVVEQSAGDLTQKTYLCVFRALSACRQESSRTRLFSIARRVCRDELRRRTRHRHQETETWMARRQGAGPIW
jgi:DNA-directed RNA polymerase specialized sigma24 family protein